MKVFSFVRRISTRVHLAIGLAALSVVMILRVALSVWVIIALGTHNLTEAVVTIVISLVVLGLVWNEKANEFIKPNFRKGWELKDIS